jgi:hypothetical protein
MLVLGEAETPLQFCGNCFQPMCHLYNLPQRLSAVILTDSPGIQQQSSSRIQASYVESVLGSSWIPLEHYPTMMTTMDPKSFKVKHFNNSDAPARAAKTAFSWRREGVMSPEFVPCLISTLFHPSHK